MEIKKNMEVRDIRYPAKLRIDDAILFVHGNLLWLGSIIKFDMFKSYPSVVIRYMIGDKQKTIILRLSELTDVRFYKLVVLK